MAKQITLNINNAKETLDTVKIAVHSGKAVIVKAQPHVNYQLTDDATNFAPENIMIQRDGDDLKVAFEGSTIEQPDLIIEGYYADGNGADSLLVGQFENGKVYPYVPESAVKADAVTELADGAAAGQALGGEPVTALWAFSPWWLLALVPLLGLGGAALFHSNGGDDGNGNQADTTAPHAPSITANDDGSITILPPTDKDTKKVTVEYTDENGQTHTAVIEKGKDGWSSTDPNLNVDPKTGKTTIPADKVKDGSTVTGTATDDSGNTSDPSTATAGDNPVIATDAPVVTFPEDKNGDGKLNAKEDAVPKGKTPVEVSLPKGTEPGDTVEITVDTNGKKETIKEPVTEDDIKNGHVTTDIPVKNGDKVTVTAKVTDPAGNESATSPEKTLEVDTQVPGDVDGNGTADNGDNSDDPKTLTKDGAPVISFPEDSANDKADGKLNKNEVGDDNATPVRISLPKGTEVGDTVEVTINGKKQSITVKDSDLTNGYVQTDPVPVKDGDVLKVTAKVIDDAGNESNLGEGSIEIDLSAPKPTLTAKDDGSVDVGLPDDAKPVDKVVVKVPQDNGPDKEVTLTKGDDGKWTSNDKDTIPDPEGNTATILADKVKDGGEVTAHGEDPAGNTADADPVNANEQLVDDTRDLTPTIEFPEDKSPKDNKLNKAEVDSGEKDKAEVLVTLPQDAREGDKLMVTIDGKPQQPITVDKNVLDNGAKIQVSVTEDTKQIKVEAKVTNADDKELGNSNKSINVDV
ncbi:hypothetical protein HPC37_10620, partial [Pasteurellaceae bacterium 20609_3]|uniref:hypothetical protein n=1 Tax=Spirabiliibacterium mucosae TaxID=28156 RepID=UPI001AACA749